MVAPLLHMVGPDLLRTHLLNDHGFLTVIAVPPYVVALDERIGKPLSDCSAFAKSGLSVMPLVVECWKVLGSCFQ